jgi:hypothetical protein
MKFSLPLLLASAALVAGCSNKQDANEKNFSAAMDQYLIKHGAMCLRSVYLRKWPVDVVDTTSLNFQAAPHATDEAAQLKALEAVGLVSGNNMEIDQLGIGQKPTGRKSKIRRYTLTETGKKAVREQNGQQDICYANMRVGKIIKWDKDDGLGGESTTNLSYHYRVDGLQDWALRPEMESAFPYVKKAVDNAGKEAQRHGVKLTNLGWEALGIDR